jgi:hypothetical protein
MSTNKFETNALHAGHDVTNMQELGQCLFANIIVCFNNSEHAAIWIVRGGIYLHQIKQSY